MAKSKKPEKVETPEEVKPQASPVVAGGKTKMDWQTTLLGLGFIACALAFLPTTLILFFGFMPTIAAIVIDHTPGRLKTLTVAALNIAGCAPFLLELWMSGESQSLEAAFSIVARAETLITIYGCAGGGYLIFYTLSSFVASFMLQTGKSRLEEVKKRMNDLERKWGREVTGALPLDERGFADETYEAE